MNLLKKAKTVVPPSIVWLGDDFTGAAAVMEVLTFAGMPSILFLDQPTPDQLAEIEGIEAFGIATLARSRSPQWMAEHLPSLFQFLSETGAALVHFKICSTLDSSPTTGSIGKAIEEALKIFGAATVPVVVAAPQMRRYQAFGNLFCSMGKEVYRLDRHPIMSHHPVTPMFESDVALHLSKQTSLSLRCLNLEVLAESGIALNFLDSVSAANICTVDMITRQHEALVGSLLWNRRNQSRFVVGSQGIEYALVAHYNETGRLSSPKPPKGLGSTLQMAVVSGSVSPITADQIGWARNNGFVTIRVDAASLAGGEGAQAIATNVVLEAAKKALSQKQIPLIYTAEGPDDPSVAELQSTQEDVSAANDAIGKSLGRILRDLIYEAGLTRVAVSGGDTSGHVCNELGIFALEAVAPTIPGAAICRAKSDTELNGLEIALKGGQMGSPDYFGWIRDGGGERL